MGFVRVCEIRQNLPKPHKNHRFFQRFWRFGRAKLSHVEAKLLHFVHVEAKLAQDEARMTQNEAKLEQDPPSWSQNGPKTPNLEPEWPQDLPRWPHISLTSKVC